MERPRLLLADDDRRVRQLVGLTLSNDDFDICFAEDGEDAVRLALELHPALILLDYAMPVLDGIQACIQLRAHAATAATPIVMLSGHGDDEVRRRAQLAGVNGFLTKPFSPLTLERTIRALVGDPEPPRSHRPETGTARPLAGAPLPGLAAGTDAGRPPTSPDAVRTPRVTQRRYADLQDTFLATIEALATALELRAADSEGHAQRVSLYTAAVARHLGVDGVELEQMRWGALLHDVGMIGIPDAILLKQGDLRPEEWALLRQHPEYGARLLRHIPGLGSALSVVRFHHERFDGAGYPLGLRGTAIPLGARIVAVADALDAITTERPYRPTRTWDQARVEILQERGSHFDPRVVDAFLEMFDTLHGLTRAERASAACR